MAKSKKPKLAVIYIRVSTIQQGKSGVGAKGQEEACRTYANALGYEVLGVYPEIGSAMGQDSINKRPELAEAFAVAEREGAIIICHDLSRISRHTETAVKLVRDTKVSVHAATTGKKIIGVVLQVAAARAESDGKLIGERTKRALDEKKATGFKLGNPTNLPEAQKAGSEKNAERARKKAEAIADIISRTPNVAEMTASEIASLLNSSGCLSGRGKPWTISAVRRPLRDAREIISGRDAQKDMDDPLFGMF